MADAPAESEKFLGLLRQELREADDIMEVTLLGEVVSHDTAGRKIVSAPTPLGPGGNAPVRKVRMALPTAEELSSSLSLEKQRTTA